MKKEAKNQAYGFGIMALRLDRSYATKNRRKIRQTQNLYTALGSKLSLGYYKTRLQDFSYSAYSCMTYVL